MSPVPTIGKDRITGLVLAGGRGSRMGGVDKGLQNFRGMPLAMHALLRLQAQVGETLINANRANQVSVAPVPQHRRSRLCQAELIDSVVGPRPAHPPRSR